MPEAPQQSFVDVFSDNFSVFGDYFLESMKHFDLMNPFWIIIMICIITFTLELILPKKQPYSPVGRKNFLLDLFYVLFIDVIFLSIGFFAFTTAVSWAFEKLVVSAGGHIPIVDISLPDHLKWLEFIIFFLLVDFAQFFGHWLLHRVEFLWKFHKIHHAQETLGFASTRHFHWGEMLVFKPLLYIPFSLLGLDITSYFAYYLWFGLFLTFFSHCNVNIDFGFLNRIFITPQTHYWHHAKNIPGRYGVNYASSLSIWDQLFGSYYLPKDKKLKPVLGIPDNDVPDSFWGQFFHPFLLLFGKKQKQSSLEEKPVAATKAKK